MTEYKGIYYDIIDRISDIISSELDMETLIYRTNSFIFTYILTPAENQNNYSIHLFSGYCDKNGVELYEGDKVKDGKKTATIVRQKDGAFRLQQIDAHGSNYNSRIHEDVLFIQELKNEV